MRPENIEQYETIENIEQDVKDYEETTNMGNNPETLNCIKVQLKAMKMINTYVKDPTSFFSKESGFDVSEFIIITNQI